MQGVRKIPGSPFSVLLAGGLLGLITAPFLLTSTGSAREQDLTAGTGPICSTASQHYRQIAAQNAHSIVEIGASGIAGDALGTRPLVRPVSRDDPFFRFYRDLPTLLHLGLGAALVGSGFIVSSDGVILTNAHLVRGANRVAVTLADRRRFSGQVIAVDLLTDVAVIKIPVHDLPAVELGNSSSVFTGEPILALGGPYRVPGEGNAAAAGVISAVGRSGSLVPFIRTDIRMPIGGSGGPLLDSCGRVVGMNAQVYALSKKGDVGALFAIPINVALSDKRQVMGDAPIAHAILSTDIGSSTPPLSPVLQRPLFRGALVERAIAPGVAARVGLRPSDIILRYNGRPVIDLAHLQSKISSKGSSEEDTLEVLRGSSVVSAKLNLRPGMYYIAAHHLADSSSAASAQPARLSRHPS